MEENQPANEKNTEPRGLVPEEEEQRERIAQAQAEADARVRPADSADDDQIEEVDNGKSAPPAQVDRPGAPTTISSIAVKIALSVFFVLAMVIAFSIAGKGNREHRKYENEKKKSSSALVMAPLARPHIGGANPGSLEIKAAGERRPEIIKEEKPAQIIVQQPSPTVADEDLQRLLARRAQMLQQASIAPLEVSITTSRPDKDNDNRQGQISALQAKISTEQDPVAAQEYARQLALLQQQEQTEAARRAALASGGIYNSAYSDPNSNLNANSANNLANFNKGGTGQISVASSISLPADEYILRTGSVIPAVLIGQINSDLPGQIIGQVSQDVFDTPTGRFLLIPKGSRLVGEYASAIKYGQTRVFAVWQRIVFPDGKALDLGAFPAASGLGEAGVKDKVDNHYLRIFGSAVMLAGIIAGVEYSQNKYNEDSDSNQQRMGDSMSSALGQTLGTTMANMIQRNMDIAPTLTVRPGFRMHVMLVKDLVFPSEYRAFDWRK